MKHYKVWVSHPAENDLKEIALYIAKELKEPLIAKSLISEMKQAIMNLSTLPTRHEIVSDERLAMQGIRKLFIKNYIVFYTISDEELAVNIIRVLSHRRNWLHLL
ncbi:type II toxin-antitoxin system RelE/ParE family toxin [Longirhabdus pacifica]|uniref:type II toxin-antitoxin system RelE/ParE family toxin n=1 Tax=Longirhabdus pacifica TaxID=2305227 RepID=UPI0010089870|nr:type II toxin-antitoxin system RelE/ParE family toxin [Longirhabdus pacifica]